MYNTLINSGINGEYDILLESFEYNILKSYFIAPTYPLFKPSNLRKDFNFALYIEQCLIKRLSHFFGITWMCWISSVLSILFWNVIIEGLKITIKVSIYILN